MTTERQGPTKKGTLVGAIETVVTTIATGGVNILKGGKEKGSKEEN